jgi:hypothetical protein
MNILNGLGKVKTTFLFMIFFSSMIWLLTPVLTSMFGNLGFPIAHLIVSLLYFTVLMKAKSIFKFNAFKPIHPFLFSALIMGVTLFTLDNMLSTSAINSSIILIVSGAIIYYLLVRFLFGIRLITQLASFYKK